MLLRSSFHLTKGVSCFRLVNPYVLPVLYIRRPGDDLEQIIRFEDDDPFFSEVGIRRHDYDLCSDERGNADL
jgi:hypothetical protein